MVSENRDARPPLGEDYLQERTVGGLRPLSGPVLLYADAKTAVIEGIMSRALRDSDK